MAGNPGLLTNLPAQASSFIGREVALAEVRRLVGGSRLVTLTGAGGAGKTRLGLQVAGGLGGDAWDGGGGGARGGGGGGPPNPPSGGVWGGGGGPPTPGTVCGLLIWPRWVTRAWSRRPWRMCWGFGRSRGAR